MPPKLSNNFSVIYINDAVDGPAEKRVIVVPPYFQIRVNGQNKVVYSTYPLNDDDEQMIESFLKEKQTLDSRPPPAWPSYNYTLLSQFATIKAAKGLQAKLQEKPTCLSAALVKARSGVTITDSAINSFVNKAVNQELKNQAQQAIANTTRQDIDNSLNQLPPSQTLPAMITNYNASQQLPSSQSLHAMISNKPSQQLSSRQSLPATITSETNQQLPSRQSMPAMIPSDLSQQHLVPQSLSAITFSDTNQFTTETAEGADTNQIHGNGTVDLHEMRNMVTLDYNNIVQEPNLNDELSVIKTTDLKRLQELVLKSIANQDNINALVIESISKQENVNDITLKTINNLGQEVKSLSKSTKDLATKFSHNKFAVSDFALKFNQLQTTVLERRPLKEDENVISVDQLNDKYEAKIPFLHLEDFLEFEKKLKDTQSKASSDLKDNFLSSISTKLDISKQLLLIMHAFFHSDVLECYVAQRPNPKTPKMAFNLTEFYKILKGAFFNVFSINFKENTFLSALGSMITGSHDWNGKRKNRYLKNNDEPTEKMPREDLDKENQE